MSIQNLTYENVRDFAAPFGFLILAATYAIAVFMTFRRRARGAQERAALVIFEEDRPAAKEIGRGR